MSDYAKILSLSSTSAVATKTSALKTYFRSVRLIKDTNTLSPVNIPSYITNILLCGNCVDPENRNLYVFYIDTLIGAAWIIEINIDTRVQVVVYYDKYNVIGFNPLHKIYNARVVHGRIIWTDNLNPVYQMDIERAKNSFRLKIGYGQYPITEEWSAVKVGGYGMDQVVSNGNNFYKSRIFNNYGHEPKTDSFVLNVGTYWIRLCLIEDAYYSMDVKNFYFEPIPPKHPPVVVYKSDDNRKINNLRQTLFQIAYRYVYMDWRKSTFSPASIVPVPQAEEETATGLANELISLNNMLNIRVNSGGEEVRAIEIIGRSSQDPSKWFLIETINKFEEQERGGEISQNTTLAYITLSISIPLPVFSCVNAPFPSGGQIAFGLALLAPIAYMSYVRLSESSLEWESDEHYPLGAKTVITTVVLSNATITSKPDWLTIFHGITPLFLGSNISDGWTLDIVPTVANTGLELNGTFTITDTHGDTASMTVKHKVNLVGVTVHVVATYPPPLSIIDNGCTGYYGSSEVTINFKPNSPAKTIGQIYSVAYTVRVNGGITATGTFNVVEEQNNTKVVSIGAYAANGDVIDVYLQYNS